MKRLPHVVMLLVAVALVAADKRERPAKPPIPAAKELEKAKVKVRDVFDIDAAISIEANAKLARRMLVTALDTADDPASQYVMLRMVRDMSARNGDYAVAERTIGEMGQRFAIDVIAMRSEAVVQALIAKKVPEGIRKRIVRDALRVVRECHKADRYKHAKKNIAAALKSATRLRDRQLLIDTRRLRDDGKVLAKQYETVRGAFETLKTKPADPAANTSAGKYVCYVKGDWKRGLAMLAQGNDALLKDLATREQRGANKHEEQIVIADAWWKIADEQPSHTSGEVRQHAQSFYRRALPQLTGLAKVKVKKRLDMVTSDVRKKSQASVKLVNLARGATYTRSAQAKGNGSSKRPFDGSYSTKTGAYWYSGRLPAWIRVAFPRPSRVHAIRLLVPSGTERFKQGHEPLEYEILVESRGKEERAFMVGDGRSATAVVANKNGKGTKFVTLRFAQPIVTSSVRLLVTRTSGRNAGPVVFEMEVFGDKSPQ